MVKIGSKWRQKSNPYKIYDSYAEIYMFKRNRELHDKPFFVSLEDVERVISFRWCLQCKKYVYNPEKGLLHRFIMSAEDGIIIDHIDRDGMNNRRCNLRIATLSQNLANSKIPVTNTTGYKGVYSTSSLRRPRSFPFMSKIQHSKKHIHIGYYMTAEEAARAYDTKAKELFGEFAKTNF